MTAGIHALLIGIDAYPTKPLEGCVNDIDRVAELLRDAEVPHVRRLASAEATLENIRAALRDLAAPEMAGERIFIYFSGHGFRYAEKSQHRTRHREAIAPVDFHEGRLLFDHELNGLIEKIVARTTSVAMVLDCCHSSGVTRGPAAPRMVARSLEAKDVGPVAPAGDAASGARLGAVADCQVVAACLAHESAYESQGVGGAMNGVFTRAFVEEVGALGKGSGLLDVSWGRIWQAVRERVARENSAQNIWMSGHPGRAVFGGPPVEGDAGYTITREEGHYRVHAGELAGVTRGARIAVYPALPARFPALGSTEDMEARIAVLDVTHSEPAAAVATADRTFETAAARGRIVAAGERGRLRCAVIPPDPEIVAAVDASPLLEYVEGYDAAQVRLEADGGRWYVADDVHDRRQRRESLFDFAGGAALAREVLEHYVRYFAPLQLAANAIDIGLQGLVLTARIAPPRDLPAAQAALADLPVATEVEPDAYELGPGSRIAFHVHNGTRVDMRVALVNCGTSGKVLLLGDTQIPSGASHMFWFGDQIGKPFVRTASPNASRSIDRLVAIGTTNVARNLDFLRVDTRWTDLGARSRGRADADAQRAAVTVAEEWAAHRVIIKTA